MTSRASWRWAFLPMQAPDKPTYMTLDFEKGVPVAIDGEKMNGHATSSGSSTSWAAKTASALLDIVENRLVGMKCRGVYETPGGTILYHAHEVLETICLDKDTHHIEAEAGRKLCRSGIQRPVVHPSAGSAVRLCGQDPGARHRRP